MIKVIQDQQDQQDLQVALVEQDLQDLQVEQDLQVQQVVVSEECKSSHLQELTLQLQEQLQL